MNKTIINGIDVSECCCFENNKCLWSKRYYENNNVAPPCEAVKNCYFKQLKRLQQENEELKEKVNSYSCNADCYKYKEANKYKQALEEIRSYCDEQNLKADYTACYITNRIDEVLEDSKDDTDSV